MEDSIFTKIIRGEIPSHKVYENDLVFAFMDIHPLVEGHLLVVPKNQIDDIERLPDEDYQALFAAVKILSTKVKRVFEAKKAIIMVQGFDVPHAHVHIFPSNSSETFYKALEYRQKTSEIEPDHAALAKLAERLSV